MCQWSACRTIELMGRLNVTAMAIDAYRTLLFERDEMIEKADAAGIAIQAFPPDEATHRCEEGVETGEILNGKATSASR